MKFLNKVVLVTGAAGQLGSDVAIKFAAEGARLWLADKNVTDLKNTVERISDENIEGTLGFDITSPSEVEVAFKTIKEHNKKLDVLINNAGIGIFSPYWEREFEDFMEVMSVNVGGTFLCIKNSIKLLAESANPAIVNIGSIYGVVSSDPRIYTDCSRMNSEAYSASKAGVIQLTKYFSAHLAEHKIRVNCVSPGGIFNNQGDDFVKNYSHRTPFSRMATVDEICGAIIFLASIDSNYITGQNIIVDGGFTSW